MGEPTPVMDPSLPSTPSQPASPQLSPPSPSSSSTPPLSPPLGPSSDLHDAQLDSDPLPTPSAPSPDSPRASSAVQATPPASPLATTLPPPPHLLTTLPPESPAIPVLSPPPSPHASFSPLPSASPLLTTRSTSAFLTTPSSTSSFAPSASSSSTAMHRTHSSASSTGQGGHGAPAGAKIWGIVCVGFDHQIGPNVEFAYPKRLKDDEELCRNLPFLALPDGAHARDEDYSYFHLLLPSVSASTPQTIFGISCNRQIPAELLINKGKDVTRSTVQKAIVVLANKPIFGPLRDKLGVVTRSFFAQRDFDDKSILVDLYQSFEPAGAIGGEGSPLSGTRVELSGKKERDERKEGIDAVEDPQEEEEEEEDAEEGEDGGMYMGTSLRELVYRFRFKTLMLLKLLMLQRRVMFFAANTPVEQLCTFQYSLVALIPALLTNLNDAASPLLSTRSERIQKATSLKTSDRRSLIRYLGLPLDVFGANSFFQPYLPLQQIDLLKTRTFLVGTTNSIFQQQRDCHIDVIVNIDTATLEILNPKLTPLITLTAADRKWMDELVTLVDSSYNPSDPARPLGQGFVGSDDFLRGKFEEYVCSLLACVKFGEFLGRERGERAEMLLSAPELESYNPSSFNEAFINAFKRTTAYELWDRNTDEAIFNLVEPKHPMEGKTNPIEDVGIRLVHGLHDHLPTHLNLSHLPEGLSQLNAGLQQLPANLKPARERLSRGWSAGGEWFAGVQGAIRDRAQGGTVTPGSEKDESVASVNASPKKEKDSETGGLGSTSTSASTSTPAANGAAVGTTFFAGVDVAKTGAAQLASGFGSFLGNARKSSFFAPRSGSPTTTEAPSVPSRPSSSSSSITPTTAPSAPSTNAAAAPFTSFLRPLSTAAAATVSSVPPPSSTSTPPQTSGLGSFFGGIRRTLTPVDTGGASSSSTSPASASAGVPPSPSAPSPSLVSSSSAFGNWSTRPLSIGDSSTLSPRSTSSPFTPVSSSLTHTVTTLTNTVTTPTSGSKALPVPPPIPSPSLLDPIEQAEADRELLELAAREGLPVRNLDEELRRPGVPEKDGRTGLLHEVEEEEERKSVEEEREKARRRLEGE